MLDVISIATDKNLSPELCSVTAEERAARARGSHQMLSFHNFQHKLGFPGHITAMTDVQTMKTEM